MSRVFDDEMRVTEQAARWLSELLDGNARREDFFAWLAESPRHVEEFLFVLTDARDIALLRPEQREQVERLAEEIGTSVGAAGGSNVVPVSQRALASFEEAQRSASPGGGLRGRGLFRERAALRDRDDSSSAPRDRVARWGFAAAAMVLLGLGATWWSYEGPGRWDSYKTAIGEQRTLELADGSVVHLNTDSEIAVDFSSSYRHIRLVRGEALFNVEHDAKRTFSVHADKTAIQAIGTQFDVYRRADGTRVSVIDGLVQIAPSELGVRFPVERVKWAAEKSYSSAPPPPATGSTKTTASGEVVAAAGPTGNDSGVGMVARAGHVTQLVAAGQAATIFTDGRIAEFGTADVAKSISWRQRRLVFESDTLERIAAEFNRYNSKVKIRVIGHAAEQQHFSGTFDADAPEAMIQALADDPTVSVERLANEIVIRNRTPATD